MSFFEIQEPVFVPVKLVEKSLQAFRCLVFADFPILVGVHRSNDRFGRNFIGTFFGSVQISLDGLLGRCLRRATVRWYVDVGSPENGIQHDLTETITAPTGVIMGARETKAASSTGTLVRPGNRLFLARGNRLANRRVAAPRTVFTAECLGGRQVKQNRGQTFLVLDETHVVVPFVIHIERFHTIADRVIGKVFEMGRPVWIY